MKVLILTSHFSPNVGGVETHLDDLVDVLAKGGNYVFVLTYRPLITKVKWKIYEKKKNVEIVRIPWIPGFFYKLVKNPILEFLYLLPGLFIGLPLFLTLKGKDIKVIHSHGLIAGFVTVFWGRIFSKRVITTTHSIYHFPKSGLYRKLAKWIFASSDCVLTLSKQSAREIEKLGIEKKRIKVFKYWIDLNKFKIKSSKLKIRKELGWEKRKFVVLFVGRLIKVKGVLELLTTASKWNKDITLVIAGTGPLEENVKTQNSNVKNIIYLGGVDNDKLPDYYNAADLVIVPSTHEEGFGRVILESLACGTPVIGSNRGAIPEAMDNTVGRLIDVTPENIKRTVEYYNNHSSELNKLSVKARIFAEKRYSEGNVDMIISAYK